MGDISSESLLNVIEDCLGFKQPEACLYIMETTTLYKTYNVLKLIHNGKNFFCYGNDYLNILKYLVLSRATIKLFLSVESNLNILESTYMLLDYILR